MSFIITRNYRDGQSPRKYLIRAEGEGHDQAIAVSEIRANGVTFQASDAYESGFGCGIVAKAQEASWWTAESDAPRERGLTRIKFGWDSFYVPGEDGRQRSTIRGVQRLVLKQKGGMFAQLNEQPATQPAF